MNLLSDKIIKVICWTLLHSLWQGLLLALLTGLVMVLSKKSSSAIRYNLLIGIFLFFLTITGLTFYVQWNQASGVAMHPSVLHSVVAVTSTEWQKAVDNNAGTGISFRQYVSGFMNYFNEHASLVVTIWFIVFIAKLVKIISGLAQMQRIKHYRTSTVPEFWKNRILELAKRIRVSREIRMLESAIVKVPMVVGFLKPTILIPIGLLTNLSPAEVESILLHELAHIRRRDYFFNLLQCFVDVVFFFNPAILWISSLIRNERENCCDDIAISESKNKKQFVQALVSFHQYNLQGMSYAMPFAGRKSKLLHRVKRIVNNNNQTLNYSEKAVLLVCLVVFSVAFTTIRQERPASSNTAGRMALQHNEIQKPLRSAEETTIHQTVSKKALKERSKQVERLLGNDTAISVPVVVDTKVNDLVNITMTNANDIKIEVGLKSAVKSVLNALKVELKSSIKTDASIIKMPESKNLEELMQSFRDLGYKNISLQQVRKLRDHGVTPEYVISFSEKGYGMISLEQATALRDHGITIDFINTFSSLGFKDISLELATALQDHGVNKSFVRSINELGYKNISLEQLINLQDAGLHPEFIRSMSELGYNNIPLEQAIDLKNHDVRPDFIRSFNQLGFKTISLEQATALRDHDVTADFIVKMRKKTGSDFSLAEYIALKDQF